MDIFIINISETENISDELLKEFSFKKFSDPKKQKIHSLVYLITDRILKEVYKINNRKFIFKNNKPFIENNLKNFSISHSGDYIAISFSDYECGVDIEENKQRDFESISKRMNFKSENLLEFYLNWTKYEAEYKLGKKQKSVKSYQLENYTLTAVSENDNEKFDIFYQG